jgi:hypothetical protein
MAIKSFFQADELQLLNVAPVGVTKSRTVAKVFPADNFKACLLPNSSCFFNHFTSKQLPLLIILLARQLMLLIVVQIIFQLPLPNKVKMQLHLELE